MTHTTDPAPVSLGMPTQPAFDDHHPPDPALVGDCVHCGFCLPTCPTYALWGEEMDSPRGRIYLMKQGLEGEPMSDSMVQHWDACLGCMACVTACPSGVQYDRLIEGTRGEVERRFARPRWERLKRRAPFFALPHPARLRVLAPLMRFAPLTPRFRLRDAWSRLPEFTPAQGTKRGRVGLMQGCVQRVMFAPVNRATVEVLAAEGFEVYSPRSPGCCGALELHVGYEETARERSRRMLAAFEDCDTIVVNAAGCGSALKEVSDKVRDVHEFLAGVEPVAERHPVDLKVAYHDACHLAHAQGIRDEPRALLRAIPGVEVVEPAEWELCCGSAGIYNLLQPEAAEKLGVRKAENLRATGAEAIAAANPGCALQ